MFAFRAQLGVLNVLLLYLLLTFFLALSGGLWPAVLSAVLGFLAFDFFFIPPFHTLTSRRQTTSWRSLSISESPLSPPVWSPGCGRAPSRRCERVAAWPSWPS